MQQGKSLLALFNYVLLMKAALNSSAGNPTNELLKKKKRLLLKSSYLRIVTQNRQTKEFEKAYLYLLSSAVSTVLAIFRQAENGCTQHKPPSWGTFSF